MVEILNFVYDKTGTLEVTFFLHFLHFCIDFSSHVRFTLLCQRAFCGLFACKTLNNDFTKAFAFPNL